jgi:DNA-binding response OmpR family regulator
MTLLGGKFLPVDPHQRFQTLLGQNRYVADERHKLHRDIERYRLLLGNITNPLLVKLLREMIAEVEDQLIRFDTPWRTDPKHAESTRIGLGTDVPMDDPSSLVTSTHPRWIGNWQLDPQRRNATTPAGKAVQLTKGEFELLLILVTHAGQTLSRKDLMALSRHRLADPSERTVDVLIGRLRRKLEADPRHPGYISTVRSLGYIFQAQSNTDQDRDT